MSLINLKQQTNCLANIFIVVAKACTSHPTHMAHSLGQKPVNFFLQLYEWLGKKWSYWLNPCMFASFWRKLALWGHWYSFFAIWPGFESQGGSRRFHTLSSACERVLIFALECNTCQPLEPLNLHTTSLFSVTYFLVVHAWFHNFFN